MNQEEYFVAPIQTADEARQCAQLIAEEFVQQNPLSVYLRPKAENLFEYWLHPAILDVLDQKLSFLVRHRSTNELVAAAIGSDLSLYCQNHPYDPLAPASASAADDFFDEMLDQFVRHEFQQRLRSNQVVFIEVVGTRSSHTGHGLAGHLALHLCNYARDQRGFEYAFAQASHPVTRHIFLDKLHGQATSVVHPETWKWTRMGDGTSCPMQGYPGEPMINVIIRFGPSSNKESIL